MGEQRGLYRLAGRTMLNDEFRVWLLVEPQEAAESVGVTLTEEQVEKIRQVDPKALAGLVHEFQSLIGITGVVPW